MLHREWDSAGGDDGNGGWKACDGTTPGHVADSRVHLYDRVVGFKPSAEEEEVTSRNPRAAAAARKARQTTKIKSHLQIVERFGLFERFCLEFHPDEPYTKWLKECQAAATSAADGIAEEKLEFKQPPQVIVLDYIQHCRTSGAPEGTEVARKYNTIKNYKSAITSVMLEMGVSSELCTNGKTITDQIRKYEEEDDESSAIAFDMQADAPKLFDAVFSVSGWSPLKRIRAWAMFLVSCCICGRASCVTQFCPSVEDIKLPKASAWDKDGLPRYIIFVWKDWKSRKKSSKGKPYPIKIHRNYTRDTRFCPVYWTLLYLQYSGHTTGPIFKNEGAEGGRVKATQWIRMTAHMFYHANQRFGFKQGCTNHSIRRSAAQWAGRCGAREVDVKNAGRWLSMEVMARYMAQGAQMRDDYEDDGRGEDPIFSVWCFKKVTSATPDGRDAM